MEIVQRDNPVLRLHAKEVPLKEIASPRIQTVIKRMKDSLLSQDDGVAIAAPQIEEQLRIFVISHKAFALSKKYPQFKDQDVVCINPVITKISKEKKSMEEGCLSVRYLYGEVERASRASIESYNERGEKFSLHGSGLLAQIFQHEIDHLDGILFIDKAKDLHEVLPETEHA